jgi:hypothetical protein
MGRTITDPVFLVTGYVVLIKTLEWIMKDRPAVTCLKWPMAVHNVFLSAGSLVMFIKMWQRILPLFVNVRVCVCVCVCV